jgi:hypothetical protein
VNDQPQTQAAAYARESNIFRYGHPTAVQSSHPRLTYNSKASGKTPWAVYLSDTDTPHATLNLPNQAWNHFVFNYQGNEVDVFVNGNLVKSVQLSDPPRIDKTDVFLLGDGDNSVWGGGLHGAISNVVYHFNALTQNAIAAAYIWKKHSNPPTSGNT